MKLSVKEKSLGVVIASALCASFLVSVPSAANATEPGQLTDDTVTESDVQQALAGISEELVLDASASIQTSESAALVTNETMTLEIPRDASEGVTLASAEGSPFTISIPDAQGASEAVLSTDGTVTYPGSDASATTVVPLEVGVQMLTTIANADAPTRYDYGVTLEEGQQIVVDPVSGGASIVNADGSVAVEVAPAWAVDANGVNVPTRYETDGQTLTQVIDHATTSGVAYPVVADPVWIPFIVRCLTSLQLNMTIIMQIASLPTAGSVQAAFGYAAYRCVIGR